MMKYIPVSDAQSMPGLRLSLTSGLPAPWSEAAKAIFRSKGIPFIAVEQVAGEANAELISWTGHRNAPSAMYNDEPPAVSWLDIINLAERLQPEPSLLPSALDDRILAFGLTNELAGERGMAWNARVILFHSMVEKFGEEAMQDNPMFRDYHYRDENPDLVAARIIEVMEKLEGQLQAQLAEGKRYLVGESLSLVDIYCSCFSQFFSVLGPDVNPMPDHLRKVWGMVGSRIEAAGYSLSPELLALRDLVFEQHIGLPLDF
jgi:glutathione S-transferase